MNYTALCFYLKNQSSIDFDTENIIVDPDRIPSVTGFHMTPGGRGFLGIVTGADWQIPICVILYIDKGGHMAMYIPRNGNTVDWANKRAFNNDDDDGNPLPNPPAFDGAALLADVCIFLDKEPQP